VIYALAYGASALSLAGIVSIAVIFGTCFIACLTSAIKLCCLNCRDQKQRVEIQAMLALAEQHVMMTH
jgi:hypothetical protein